jgi:amino acid permease
MRYFSLLSLACLALTLLVLVGELYFYIAKYWDANPSAGKPIAFDWSIQIFNGAGIVFFAYTNQAQMLPIYSELSNPVKRRIMKVIRSSTVLVVTFYYIMALSGYFSTLKDTPEIVITRKNIPGLKKDYAKLLCCFLIAIVMLVNCVCNYMPFRNSLYYVLTGKRTLIPMSW